MTSGTRQLTALERRLAARFPEGKSRIGIWGMSSSEYFTVLRSLIAVGRIVVPLNTRISARELAQRCDIAGLAGILYLSDFPESHLAELPRDFATSLRDLCSTETTVAGAISGAPDDIAVLMLTSGSSGESKAVALTNRNILEHSRAVCVHLRVTGQDCWLACLPLFHVGGLMIPFRCMLAGASFVTAPSGDAEEINSLLDSGKATLASVVPTQLRRMLDVRHDRPYPASVRAIIVGGGMVPLDLLERCPIAFPTYGMSETCSMIACARPGCNERERRSAGALLPGTSIRIVNETGGKVDQGISGEITTRGPGVAAGYWNGSSLVALAMSDGWVTTGDTGYLDEYGCLHVLGRADSIFKSGGQKIAPHEIECELLTHPAIESVVVLGIPDLEWGTAAAAFVVMRHGAKLKPGALEAHLRTRVSIYKIPKKWVVADKLPMLANEKPDLEEIRRRLS